MKIKGITHTNVLSVDVNETVGDAVERMAKNDVDALIVIDSEKPVGILTGDDLAIGCLGAAHHAWECPVFRHLSMPLISASSDMESSDALQLKVEKEIRHLPVFKNDDLVGIVAMIDIVKEGLHKGAALLD